MIDTPVPATGETVATPEGDLGRCSCGGRLIDIAGMIYCEKTVQRFEIVNGYRPSERPADREDAGR